MDDKAAPGTWQWTPASATFVANSEQVTPGRTQTERPAGGSFAWGATATRTPSSSIAAPTAPRAGETQDQPAVPPSLQSGVSSGHVVKNLLSPRELRA